MTEKHVKYVSVEIQGETARRLQELQEGDHVVQAKDKNGVRRWHRRCYEVMLIG